MEFHVEGMTCGGCARSVAKAIEGVDPQASVQADPASRRVQVQTSASEAQIVAALNDAGFPPRAP
ncbi:heavy-metal-associated domain-containing protein [Stenotrophomonas maltophilia]|jgi:Copper chaperone|uniref:heavy-metal-associated domain-containing protein n=1 Tax=Stenotrophomonas TaxID=40323 RepID=UPI0005B8B1A0|nr:MULTISPECIES: heavy-metal-associated domain-containing protein [Stenotrophomonas]ALA86436.1 heavy metal transport/detoxification protein [Stenotrophomonas maltophilia]ALA90392.1 heavy metal transport/detoxification protein [Stenotrophomonas maltophilia]MBH1463439.1 heavy-metal-associated domain-containing protein [Stenotrophomonas maltophilia]MBH1839413.1 heavy-metal-associated domain-containing protein [Stenotrophomonas maltophilia]MCI1091627.1 heavy-metal-associated domain-containing prot